jgi:hypothetical protein
MVHGAVEREIDQCGVSSNLGKLHREIPLNELRFIFRDHASSMEIDSLELFRGIATLHTSPVFHTYE